MQLPIILGGSALAYAMFQSSQADAAVPLTAPGSSPQTRGGANNSMPVGLKAASLASGAKSLTSVGGKGGTGKVGALVTGGIHSEIQLKQKIAELEARAKAAYDKLSSSEKKAAAVKLNAAIRPSPGLTGNESFAECGKKIGAAFGATVGVAACNAVPIPGAAQVMAHTVCATLGTIVGAYLGATLGDWAKDVYDTVTSWADDAWDSTGGKAVGWVSDIF